MSTTFILKRKYFADQGDQQKKGMSTGAKVAAGVGTAALAFAGARRGAFGGNIAMKANNAYINAGKRLAQSKSATISGLGTGMVQSGAEKWAAGSAQLKNQVAKRAGKAGMEGDTLTNYVNKKTTQKMNQVASTVDQAKMQESGFARILGQA